MERRFARDIPACLLFVAGAFLIPDCFISRHVTTGVLGVAIFAIAYTVIWVWQSKTIKITPLLLTMLSFSALWLIYQFLNSLLAWHDRIGYVSLALLFFIFSQRNHDEARLKPYYFICSLAGACMACWGLFQYLGIASVYYSPVRVTGSFENPTGIAIFLSALFPSSLFFTGKRGKGNKLWGYFASLLMVSVILLSHSRTGMLIIVVTCLLHAYQHVNLSRWSYTMKKYLLPGVVLVIILLFVGLYYWKKDSADGRMLIWLCSWDMFLDHWLAGAGSGSFQAEYMQYQAAYFREYPASLFGMLADNVRHPFNEYLKILAEYGLVGFGFLLAFVFYLVKAYRHNRDDRSLLPVFYSLLAIGISACFSYPLNYPGICLILGLNLAIVSSRCFKGWGMKKKSGVLLFKGVLLASVLCLSWTTFHWIGAERKWHDVASSSLAGMTEAMLPCYRAIYPWMKHDGLFLYNYGTELHGTGKHGESLAVLKECRVYFNDVDVQLLLADNYFHMQRYKETEEHLLLASAMCPVRFMPLYKLFQVYMETGDMTRAVTIGREILDKPVKIMSPKVKYIQADVKRKLTGY